jgi:hypothetical protein
MQSHLTKILDKGMLIMNRKRFISITSGTIVLVGTTSYLLSDKTNLSRADLNPTDNKNKTLKPDEKEILFLASLAPSGHNTQPWFVQYLKPYHWIIGNDQSKWLPAVDQSIAIHPMTQILEEASTRQTLNQSIGIGENIQFILRTGYLKDYPQPVSLRRPVDWFVWRNLNRKCFHIIQR